MNEMAFVPSPLAASPFLAAGPAMLPVPPPSAPAPVATTVRPSVSDQAFWALVRQLRTKVADRVRDDMAGRTLDPADREQAGRHHIAQVVRDHSESLVAAHQAPLSGHVEARLAQVLFDAIFRLGRLQTLVDLPGATDIEIYAHDRVLVLFADGRRQWFPPVAESDAELIEYLQLLPSLIDPHNERPFTPVHRHLEMPLPGRARLAAAAFGVTPGVRVTIRLQHLQDVDLAALREQDEIDTVLESFLTAAVNARKSIVIAGEGQGSGKTTFLRALCSALSPGESVATIEDNYELWLHLDHVRHHRVFAQQSFGGAGESRSGSRAGQITTGDLLRRALRHSIDRVIVGEVRDSDALLAMFEAMQAGNGSMSTVHADSARDVVERLVGLSLRDAGVTEAYAYRQIAQTIDLIVFLGVQDNPDGSKTRFVQEVIEPTRGEGGNPVATTDVFVPNYARRAVPNIAPSFINDLIRAGFDQSILTSGGTWRAR